MYYFDIIFVYYFRGGTHSTLFVIDGRGKKLSEVRGPHTNHWVRITSKVCSSEN